TPGRPFSASQAPVSPHEGDSGTFQEGNDSGPSSTTHGIQDLKRDAVHTVMPVSGIFVRAFRIRRWCDYKLVACSPGNSLEFGGWNEPPQTDPCAFQKHVEHHRIVCAVECG